MADVTLYFWHPAVQRKYPSDAPDNTLLVKTGANSIKWGYKLNTNKVPTYGGEVVQILSPQIMPLNISGLTTSRIQLEGIYKWFRAYMTLAGVNAHNQIPIRFQYPERGWELGIFITSAPTFTLDRDQVAATWQITAEVEQDDKALIEDIVMQPLNYAMPAGLTNRNILPFGVGFVRRNRFSEYLPENTAMSDDKLNQWFESNASITANNLGDNFQSLVASWSGGDFAHFVLDPTSTPASNGLTDADKIWQKLFNSTNVDGSGAAQPTPAGSTPGASGGSLSTLSGALQPEQVAAIMVAAGFPANEDILTEGVATAYAESTWITTNTNTNSNGSIDRGLFQINSVHTQYDSQRLLSDPVYNAKAALAIWDGSGKVWGNSNGTGAPWFGHGAPAYYGKLDESRAAVKRYLANPTAYNGSGGPSSTGPSGGQVTTGTQGELAKMVLAHPNISFDPGNSGKAELASGQGKTLDGAPHTIALAVYQTLLLLADSGLKINVSSVMNNHLLHSASGNVSEHSIGHAMDINKVNGELVEGGTEWVKLVRTLLGSSLHPHQVIGPGPVGAFCTSNCNTGLPAKVDIQTLSGLAKSGTEVFHLSDHQNHIHIGYADGTP